MSWEQQLFALFDDLEQQAEGVFAVERDLEVAERAQAEYAAVTAASRLMASVGAEVRLRVEGVGAVAGTLQRVADGWCLLEGNGGQWLVRTEAIQSANGLSPRSVPEAAWPVTARLGLGSALRRIAEAGEACRICLRDGTAYDVRLGRVGSDFVEARLGEPWPGETRLGGEPRESTVFPFLALAAVQQAP